MAKPTLFAESGFRRLRIDIAYDGTNFFGWGEVWVASGWLLLTGLGVSVLASLVTLRRYLKV
jgi:cell division protein FtsX